MHARHDYASASSAWRVCCPSQVHRQTRAGSMTHALTAVYQADIEGMITYSVVLSYMQALVYDDFIHRNILHASPHYILLHAYITRPMQVQQGLIPMLPSQAEQSMTVVKSF